MIPQGGRIGEEMEHHLHELAAQLEREGLTPEQARAEALRRFGDPERLARATRAADSPPLLRASGGLRGDLVQVLRGLRRTPAFTASVVLTLSLALGATVAVFGVFWDVLVRPLDLAQPETLVALAERMPESGVERSPVSQGTYQDWRRDLQSVSSVVAYSGRGWFSATLEDPEQPEHLATVEVSGDFFTALGVKPLLGRVFTAADEVVGGTPSVVILAHDFWARRFASDPAVIGRSLPVDGTLREVVGVLPPRADLVANEWAEVYNPSSHTPGDPTNRGGRMLRVVARLRPGFTVADASAEVEALGARIAAAYPQSAAGWSAEALPLAEYLVSDAERPLRVALAGVALLLLIAAVNVANLLNVRATDRSREMAVRAAMGAGRARLVRLGLVEAGLLGAAGALGGLTLASALRRWLVAVEPNVLPRLLQSDLPATAAFFGVLVATVLALAVGAAAAVRGADEGLRTLGRGAGAGGPARGRVRGALVVAQLALTVVLLVGAGLLVRTVSALRAVDVGYQPEGVVAARVSLDAKRYPERPQQQAYFDALVERVRAIPGVQAAGLTSSLPMDGISANFDLPTLSDRMEGLDWGQATQVDFRMIGPGLMEALGFRVVRGRTLTDADRLGAPLVALVNESLAERFWPGADPIGRRVQSVWRSGQWFEVIGVVADTRFYGPRQPSRPELFVPLSQMGWSYLTVVASASGDLARTEAALQRAFLDVDPLVPPQEVFRVTELVDAQRASESFYAFLLTGFALLALSLAASGVYGTFAYLVRRRTKEVAVRLALGARRGSVVGRILGGGLGMAALGVLLGLAAAIPATRSVSGMLFGVERLDPITIAGVALLLLGVAAAACLQPALRAARLDPASVLRED